MSIPSSDEHALGLNMPANLKMFPDRRAEVLHDKVLFIMSGMSEEDLDALQNDRMGGFEFPQMPSILAEYFHDWISDYGYAEVALSHENIHETHAKFYEHVVDHADEWDKEQVAMALAMLANGKVGPSNHLSLPTTLHDDRDKSSRMRP